MATFSSGRIMLALLLHAFSFTLLGERLLHFQLNRNSVLLWVYYSAQLFFWGAEFSKVCTKTLGSQSDRPY